MPLDPYTAAVMELMKKAYPDIGATVTDIGEARRIYAKARFPSGPPVAVVEDRKVPGTPDVPVRVYWPELDGSNHPLLVYFHGGGFVMCDLDTHDGICRMLAANVQAVVVAVDYRLAPEHRYPAALDDARTVVRWLSANAVSLGCDPGRLAVAGDSAGATIAAVTCLRNRDLGGPPIVFQLLLYPETDVLSDLASRHVNAKDFFLTDTHMAYFHQQYLGEGIDPAHPCVSPLRAERLAELPPALVLTAECDLLRDEGEAYARRLAASGVPARLYRADGLFHGFFGLAEYLPAAREAEETVYAVLRDALATSGRAYARRSAVTK